VIHHRTPQFAAVLDEGQAGGGGAFRAPPRGGVGGGPGGRAPGGGGTEPLSPRGGGGGGEGGQVGGRRGESAPGGRGRPPRGEWGRAGRPEMVAEALAAYPAARAVFVQASETSTCALHPVPALADLCRRRDTLLVVDGITAVGVIDLPMDRLGIDVLITGSQKALMLPPGLAFVGLSPRAWAAPEQSRLPRSYFHFPPARHGIPRPSP